MTRSLALLVVAVIAAGCSGDPGPPAPDPDPIVAESDGCDDQDAVVNDPTTRLEEELTGDIDGDGSDDVVYLAQTRSGDRGCMAFVVAETEQGTVSEPVWKIGREGGLPQPRLNSLAQIDGDGGLEILVDEIAGASTQFVGAFTFIDGELERIEPADPAAGIWAGASDGVFPYGGSVGHVEAVDCADDGEIVVSVALPGDTPSKVDRGIYSVTRRFFAFEGAELIESDTQEEEVEFDFGKTYPEFGSSPFGSCPIA
jgi:hypothetical protein